MPTTRATVIAEQASRKHKLFKVWFGRDGSYYVTVPYHTAKTASLLKRTVRYGIPFGKVASSGSESLIDVAVLGDNNHRLKMAHHPDGFCQFSGHGIQSGKDKNGRIKGIGVHARALRAIGPKFGPVFGVTVFGIDDFDACDQVGRDDVLIRVDDLAPATPWPSLRDVISCHYPRFTFIDGRSAGYQGQGEMTCRPRKDLRAADIPKAHVGGPCKQIRGHRNETGTYIGGSKGG